LKNAERSTLIGFDYICERPFGPSLNILQEGIELPILF
jgi:hypothetical protein